MSDSSRPLCAICNTKYAIYTCPRCSARTCSLSCSSTHKNSMACSGIRDKTAFVPMNEYGYGTLMSDYTLLEDVGRRVGDWGKEIAKGGMAFNHERASGNRGRGGSKIRGTSKRSKRDILKMNLENTFEITMELLPQGMERKKTNQSSWDFKSQNAILTVEFKIYFSKEPTTLLTHRNNLSTPLLILLSSNLASRLKEKSSPSPQLLEFSRRLADVPIPYTFRLFHSSSPLSIVTVDDPTAYHYFDPAQPLSQILHKSSFIEFPTIEIFLTDPPEPRTINLAPAKRQKMELAGLLNDYGSGSDAESGHPDDVTEDLKKNAINGLTLLESYSDDEDDEEAELDPETLLALVRRVQGSDGERDGQGDDAIDWGDNDSE